MSDKPADDGRTGSSQPRSRLLARPGVVTRSGLQRAAPLLRSPRYEVFPAASIEQAVLDWVPKELTVTVTASPARGLEPTLDLTERLAGHGYHVVPHLSARLVRDDAHPPAGQFASALSLLERLTEMGRPFARVEITGYPESHPRIDDDVTIQAMWDKRQHATY